jgi:4,5-dihydroxyphthalate decarboxylase
MTVPVLKSVTRTQGNNSALKDGTVKPVGFNLEFEEVPVLVHAFRRMVRGLEFDVCEMALTTYLCAKEHGVKFTGIPIFLVRAFHHGAILHNINRPINDPRELEGKRVGVNRGYTVTTGVWARSVLQSEYGVDLNKVTWVLSGDEHVQAYQPPSNVVPIEEGKDIEQMLLDGELSAAINIKAKHPDIQPLISNPEEKGIAAFKANGHYPINHLVVIRDEILEKYPDVAGSIFNAFAESKRIYLERLLNGKIEKPTEMDELYIKINEMVGEPLPYGIPPNLEMLENLFSTAASQQILKKPVGLNKIFVPSTLDLIA